MKIRLETLGWLCAFAFVIGFAMPTMAQTQEAKSYLPFELQVIISEYNKKRVEGLTRLYRQSIDSLRKAQAPFLRDGKLKESAAIESKIDELEKKITALTAGKTSQDAGKSPHESGETK